MEIKKETTVKLSPDDLREIIKKHLKETQNLDVTSIYFRVSGHEDPTDWRAEFPLTYMMDEAICNATGS